MGAIGNWIGGELDSNQRKESEARSAALGVGTQIGSASLDAIDRAKSISARTYTPYKGERVAGLSTNEQAGTDLSKTGFDASRGYYDKAGQTIDSVAGSDWNAETRDKYMDPYVGGVVDTALRKEGEAYSKEKNAQNLNATSRGAFGGSRATLLEASTTGRHLDAVGDITSKGYSDAYQNAFASWQADKGTKLQAARDYESVGGDLSRLNSDQIQNLMQTGQADRVVRQLTDDTKYQAFVEQRDWDVTNLQPLLASISAARGGVMPNASGNKSNGAADVVGLVSSIVGYFGSNSKQKTTYGQPTSADVRAAEE